MNKPGYSPWKKLQEQWLSRRSLIRGAAGTALGAGLLRPKLAYTDDDDSDSEYNRSAHFLTCFEDRLSR